MPFKNENVAAGLPINSKFQAGKSNVDNNEEIERYIPIAWSSNPVGSYLYYDCTVGVTLDSGMVTHTPLPQSNSGIDTLAVDNIDTNNFDRITGPGVNLKSLDSYKDIVQRMAHSRYWFRLWGQAIRIGHRVPIPGIKTIGGVQAVPHDNNPQWAFNRIMPGGNFSGLILWHAQWSLWYTCATPPNSNDIPEINPGAHITGTARTPDNIQSPFSRQDSNAEKLQLQGIVILR